MAVLIEAGADVSLTDELGDTPLHTAAGNGFHHLLCALLTQGADPLARNHDGQTPAELAGRFGHRHVVERLEELGRQPAQTLTRPAPATPPANEDAEADDADSLMEGILGEQPRPPWPRTVKAWDGEGVERLLREGGDLDMLDRCGDAPLHWAASEGRIDLVERLLDHGADIHIEADDGELGDTPLHAAAWEGRREVVKSLLARGANVNYCARKLWSLPAINPALAHGHWDIVELMVRHGADLNSPSLDKYDDRRTLLNAAAWDGKTDVVRRLLELGAEVNYRDLVDCRTALHLAVEEGHKKTGTLLLEHGARVDLPDDQGETPVTVAASHSRHKLRKLLEDHARLHGWVTGRAGAHYLLTQLSQRLSASEGSAPEDRR